MIFSTLEKGHGIIMQKKILSRLIIFLLMISTLAGCGQKEEVITSSGMSINKDFSITAHLVEDFDLSKYSVDELKAMLVDEIGAYATHGNAEAITANEPVAQDGTILLTMNYQTAQDYSEFNGRTLYIASLSEAVANSKISISLKSAKDGSTIDASSIENVDKYAVVITDEAGWMTTPGKIAYYSDGVTIIEKKKANISNDMDGLAYIVFEN